MLFWADLLWSGPMIVHRLQNRIVLYFEPMETAPTMIIPLPWEATIYHLERMFSEEGFRTSRSFGLQASQAEFLDTNHCPHQNSSHCNCFSLVYQLRLEGADQVTLVVLGDEHETHIKVEDSPDSLDLEMLDMIRHRVLLPLVRANFPLN